MFFFLSMSREIHFIVIRIINIEDEIARNKLDIRVPFRSW